MKPRKKKPAHNRARLTTPLCGYRLMWLMVLFDLPVETPPQRKAASDFRNDLLDLGFERCQFSVYLRFCEGREQADTYIRRVSAALPKDGKVYCLVFTDRQYQSIVRFEGQTPLPRQVVPGQFALF
jgi:CRISPR-associated protein Cas2